MLDRVSGAGWGQRAVVKQRQQERHSMADDRVEGEHGIPVRARDARLQNEATIFDQRPREQKRDLAFLGLLAVGIAAGAGISALAAWVLAEIVGQHYSPFVYVVVAAVGASVLPGLTPYLSLARSDGADAGTVRWRGRRGQADTPIEGAEAADLARGAAPHGGRDV
jgi:hypothetical protein